MALRTVDWVDGAVVLIDQTRLPHVEEMVRVDTVGGLVDAIQRLVVRGAPALGVAGAYGVALALAEHRSPPDLAAALSSLRDARPTAVNLRRMVDRVAARIEDGFEAVLAEADAVRDSEIAASIEIGRRGADLVRSLVGDRPVRVMTVCNTGGLAAVERGTALAIVQTLHEDGHLAEALPVETRPLLQGARLTTWELGRMGAPHRLLVDAAGPYLLARGAADVVLAGADRVAANGDTANKIGTYSAAVAALAHGVPFYVAAPLSTVDFSLPDGDGIPIEERAAVEVTHAGGVCLAPEGVAVYNPAFDVTPHACITAIITEKGVVYPPFDTGLTRLRGS